MPKIYNLETIPGNGFYWNESDTKSGSLQFTDCAGDQYYSHTPNYRIALIGHGSTIAYYLTALAVSAGRGDSNAIDLFKHMLLFGKTDPWEISVRGTGYLNQEAHVISHWSNEVTRYSDDYMRRAEFVAQNAAAFKRAVELGATLAPDDVYSVDKHGDLYMIWAKGTAYYAAFVVVALGLGPHRGLGAGIGAPQLERDKTPLEIARCQEQLKAAVIDLDAFMRLYPETKQTASSTTAPREKPVVQQKILVHGANAGIDAAQRAWHLGHEVVWLCPDNPIFLPNNRLPIDVERTGTPVDDIHRHMLVRGKDVVVKPADAGKVQASWTERTGSNPELEATATVDVYVVSVGQDPFAKGAVGDVLFKAGNIKPEELSIVWDFDQVFGLPFQTALGYQVAGHRKGFGLQIIGASCETLAREFAKEGKVFETKNLHGDFVKQLAPVGVQPSQEKTRAEFERLSSKSKAQHVSVEAYHEHRVEDWKRATVQAERFKALASDYLNGLENKGRPPRSALLNLLIHQIDSDAIPSDLTTILKKFEDDVALVGQLATKDRPATTATSSTVLPSQLGAVRAVVAALNAFIPEYIRGGDANFNTDDRNMLAVYLAQHFDFEPSDLQARVSATMSLRRSKENPVGFHDDELHRIIQERWKREGTG
jgi:hypothetical protein